MHLNKNLALFSIIIFLWSAVVVDSFRYLAVLPSVKKSHFMVGEALMKALALRNHQVYVISAFPQTEPLNNYFDIPVEFNFDEFDINIDAYDGAFFRNMFQFLNGVFDSSEYVLKNENVKELMASNETFDAVICEVYHSELLFGLSEHFKAPLIGLSTFGSSTSNTDMVGSPSPLSYVPYFRLGLTDRMYFLERGINFAVATFERLYIDFYYLPRQAGIYNKYFPHVARDLYTVRQNAALVLVNKHVSFSSPRPYMPNHIEVGGLHIEHERSPLPHDIQKFIDEAEHGVVYFSMGAYLGNEDLAFAKIREFVTAFGRIKQRVLWKFEEYVPIDLKKNILISNWFPQNDILAHENVKAFISHCGRLSTIESIYHGVPIIAIPMFRDQFYNTAKAEADGIAIKLDYEALTADDITRALSIIIENKSYRRRIKEISKRYKDRPLPPKNLAVFWVEHVVRQKGAKHMHCAGLDLNFFQYHNIDAILLLIGFISANLFILIVLIAYFFKMCFGVISFWRDNFLN